MPSALRAEGIVSKQRLWAEGRSYGGKTLARGALYRLLQNRIYRGEIVHKKTSYPAEHPPIIDQVLWDGVGARADRAAAVGRGNRDDSDPAPASGRVGGRASLAVMNL